MRSPALQSAHHDTESPLEVYYRRIIESQPVCLTRIATDGTFVAVNDAAVSLLGAERLEQVLDTTLLALVGPDDREGCRAFLARIAGGDRGSIEVDLTGLGGLRHTLQIHAVAIPGSADSLAAVFCTFRDITEHRRLERALMESATREEQQVSALSAERERLNAALLETRDATASSATAAELARAAALEAALADAEARHRDVGEQHSARQAQLMADFESAQQQFEASLTEQLARIAQIEGALRASETREREGAERHAADEQAWKAALAQASAENEVQGAALRQSIASLEQSLAEAAAREQALAAAHAAEETRWHAAQAGAAAERDAELAALRQAVTALERSAREAERARDEVVAQYDADRANWLALTAEATAEAEATLAGLQQQIETLEALQSGYLLERADLEQAAAEAETARARLASELAGTASQRMAIESQNRRLARHGRGARLAVALAGDLEAALALGIERGRRLLEALPPKDVSRSVVEQWLAATSDASTIARRIRREAQAPTAALAGDVVRALEPALGALLSPDIALSVLVGSHDAQVDLTPEQFEQLVLTLAANRRTTMLGGGHASLEVADVDLDDTCGLERGASPGAYLLVALHVAGPGVDAGLPDALFSGPASAETWRAAGPGLAGILQLAQAAGGHVWATREGPDAVAFEVYLPRVEPGIDEVSE